MNHYYPKHRLELKLYNENNENNENKATPHIELVTTNIKYSKPNNAYLEPEKWKPFKIRNVTQEDNITGERKAVEKTYCPGYCHESYRLNNINDNLIVEYTDNTKKIINFPEYDDIEKPLIFTRWKGGDSMDLYWHTNGEQVDKIKPGTKESYFLIVPEEWDPIENMGDELWEYGKELLYDEFKVYSYYHDPNVRYVISSMFTVNKEPSMGGFKECLLEEI